MTSCANTDEPSRFRWVAKGKCLGGFDRGYRHPDDGVGCPLFGGWIKPDRTFECWSRGAVRTDRATRVRKPSIAGTWCSLLTD